MKWAPIDHAELSALIAGAVEVMEPQATRLWKMIRIRPVKWQLDPWGNEGGGFWVVGLFGELVLWFNDIEYGFNVSPFDTYGVIGEYWCNQEELQHAMYFLIQRFELGQSQMQFEQEEPLTDGTRSDSAGNSGK